VLKTLKSPLIKGGRGDIPLLRGVGCGVWGVGCRVDS